MVLVPRSPPGSKREPGEHPRLLPWVGRGGFGAAEGLWEYPCPRGCSVPPPPLFLPGPRAFRSRCDRFKSSPEGAGSSPGASQGSGLGLGPSSPRVPRILRWSSRVFPGPGRYSWAGIGAPLPARIATRASAAAPLFSSAPIVLRPGKGERTGER